MESQPIIQSVSLIYIYKQDNYNGSIFTTLELSITFVGSWSNIENWVEPKTKPPLGNLACPNP